MLSINVTFNSARLKLDETMDKTKEKLPEPLKEITVQKVAEMERLMLIGFLSGVKRYCHKLNQYVLIMFSQQESMKDKGMPCRKTSLFMLQAWTTFIKI